MELNLDCNAHMSLDEVALKEYCLIQNSPAGWGHPSSPNQLGREAARIIEVARSNIATLLGASKPSQIIFTSTCTQACEWGMEMFLYNKSFRSVASSPLEHSAVRSAYRKVLDCIGETCGIEETPPLEYSIPIDPSGQFRPTLPYQKTIAHLLHNEIGTIQDLSLFTGESLFSDICQAVGKIPLNLSDVKNLDVAVAGAHKFRGPAGVGFIYLKDLNLYETFGTGSRYFMDRPGTPDVASIHATSIALQRAIETMEERKENQQIFSSLIEKEMKSLGFQIIGEDGHRSPSTTFALFPNRAIEILFKLSQYGIHIGLGSACGAVNVGDSPTLKALGLPADSHSAIRISQWGLYGATEAKQFIEVLKKVLDEI